MSLLALAQKRSRTTITAFCFLLIAGIIAFQTIAKEADPDITIPIIYVSLSHEGISPEDAEKLLIKPMEIELRSLEGLKELRSTAHQGGGSVVAEFHPNSDIKKALVDVREKVDKAKAQLPTDTDEPTINEVNLNRFPVLNISVYGNVPYRLLDKIGRKLRDDIQTLPNVLTVDLVGAKEEVIEIIISPTMLESYNLQIQDLIRSLQNANQLIAAGGLRQNKGEFAIEVAGGIQNEKDILNLPLLTKGEAVVKVKDIATIKRTFKQDDTISHANGRTSLTLLVKKRTGKNIIQTIEQVRKKVETTRANLPQDVKLLVGQDKSQNIKSTLRDLANNITSAILLVMIVVLAVLGFQSGFLVGLTIPASFLTAILLLYSLGFTINIVVLFALILSTGMLVDGAIVVSEYSTRRINEGLPIPQAYREAGERMAWPIIASTLTTLAAFLPLVFWPGIVGEFIKYLPLTVLFVLSASLLMALVFMPVLGTYLHIIFEIVATSIAVLLSFIISKTLLGFLGNLAVLVAFAVATYTLYYIRKNRQKLFSFFLKTQTSEGTLQTPGYKGGELKPLSDRGFTGIYIKFLSKILYHPKKIMFSAFLFLLSSYLAYGVLGKGIEFFPSIEPDSFIVGVSARGNLSLAEKSDILAEVEQHALDLQNERGEFQMIITEIGNTGGNESRLDNIGNITLELYDWKYRRKANEIIADLKSRMDYIAGIHLEFIEQESGPGSSSPVHVQIAGEEWQDIIAATQKIKNFMVADGRFVDIEDSLPIPKIIWSLDLDQAQASKFGVDVQTLGNFVRLITQGFKITDIQPDDSHDKVDIVARFPQNYRSLEQLNNLRINTPQGAVPVDTFLTRKAKQESGVLQRVDSKRIHFVKSDVADGVLTSKLNQNMMAWLKNEAGNFGNVEISLLGEDEQSKESQAFLKKAFAASLFIMAVILLTQFNNFYNVFLILASVVMSTSGVLLGLIITGQPFGVVMCGIGVIALAGIVVNNNIVLIDTYDSYMAKGLEIHHAILRTSAERLRPVLLTTITTVLGLLPMTLKMNIDFLKPVIEIGAPSTQWWTQLATSIVFGLTFATILTLIVTPCALILRQKLGLLDKVKP